MADAALLTSPSVVAALLVLLASDAAFSELTSAQRDAIRAALADRPTVTWLSLRPGEYLVDGQEVHSDLASMGAAWCAMHWPNRRVVRAADFAAPGAAHPDASVRNGLARAATVLGPICPALADAVRSISVECGYVVHRPTGAMHVEVGGSRLTHGGPGPVAPVLGIEVGRAAAALRRIGAPPNSPMTAS